MIASAESLEIELQPEPAKPATLRPASYNFFALVEALKRLRNDDLHYDDWLKVGMALHHTDPDLLAVWVQWSRQSKKHVEGACEAKWSSFAEYTGTPVTAGTIFHLAGGEQPEFRFHDGVDFLQMDFPQVDLIKGCLVENQSCIAGGGLKTMKTTVSMEAVLSVATGTDFLFQYPCKRGPAAFMSGESGDATLQETMRRILKAKRATLERGYFRITSDLPLFTQPLEKLETMLKDWGIILLVIDPLYLCMDGDGANNLFKMGPQLRNVGQMCCENGITPILNHHVTKSAGASNKTITPNDLQWSGAGEFARQWWLLNRVSDYVQGTGRHSLYLSIGSSSGLSKGLFLNINEGVRPEHEGDPPRTWEVEVINYGDLQASKNEEQYQAAVVKVREALSTSGPMLQTPLRDAACINGENWKRWLPRMIEEKAIAVTPETVNKTRKQYTVGSVEQ